MGGASSWLAMLAIAGFFASVWMAAKFSRVLRVSSIVLEVAVGLILGPYVLKLIPLELSLHLPLHTLDCEGDLNLQLKYAKKGPYYCDLGAYEAADKYDNFFNNFSNGYSLYSQILDLEPGPRCGGGSGAGLGSGGSGAGGGHASAFSAANDGQRRLRRLESTSLSGGHGRVFEGSSRRLAGVSQAGETNSDDYTSCLITACELDRSLAAATTPDVFTLAGHIGVAMMIFESGMHFDFEQAKLVGPRASAVAVLGTFLPLISGCALAMGFGFDLMQGLAAGVSLAPTSVGIALRLLHEADALNLYFGQAVMTAAFVDDVLSLVLFNVLFSLGPCMTFESFVPTIIGIVFMFVAIIFATKGFPPMIEFILSKVPETKPHAKITRHQEVMFFLMLGTLLLYGHITYMCGTHLWGCFIAGMSFATDHNAHRIWVRQVKRNTVWFLRCFFACTLAWSIPVQELFNVDAFWKGTLMGIGPCILTKVCCGPFMGDAKWVIGWAMVGRAEFAYFIAIMANSVNLMSDELFAILVWSLIYATIFAPLIFRKVLVSYMNKLKGNTIEAPDDSKKPQLAHQTTGHLCFEDPVRMVSEVEDKLSEKIEELQEALGERDERIAQLEEALAKASNGGAHHVTAAQDAKVEDSKPENAEEGNNVSTSCSV